MSCDYVYKLNRILTVRNDCKKMQINITEWVVVHIQNITLTIKASDNRPPASLRCYCWRTWNTALKQTIIQFHYLGLNKARQQSESSINQKVSIRWAVAARANEMITHINNRPAGDAHQRTHKGRRRKAKGQTLNETEIWNLNESRLQSRIIEQWQRFSGNLTCERIQFLSRCLLQINTYCFTF